MQQFFTLQIGTFKLYNKLLTRSAEHINMVVAMVAAAVDDTHKDS